MPTYQALLRATNVAGHQQVPMAGLPAMVERLRFEEVRMLLQTGNVVFRPARAGAALERRLEAEAKRRLGLETDFFVRTKGSWPARSRGTPSPARPNASRVTSSC